MASGCCGLFLVAILCIAIGVQSVYSARVLFVPGPHNSHVNFFSKAARVLQDVGHEVYVLTPQSCELLVEKAGVNKLVHLEPKDKEIAKVLSPVMDKVIKGESNFFSLMFFEIFPAITQYCKDVLCNDNLMDTIKGKKFDLVVNDGMMFYTCLYVLPYRLDLKYITLSAMYSPWIHGVPAMPSIEPSQILPFTNKMSFFQRAANVIIYIFVTMNPVSYLYGKEIVEEFVPDKPYKTFNQLMSASQVTLVNNDVMCSGYPRVSSPSYHFIGGLSATPAKPLPDDLKQFADGAKEGMIVLSLGSLKALHSLWPIIKPKFMGAFRRLPQRAVVQYALDDVSDVPDNVKLVKWLPQNDLLGHPNTKLFITHGGNNGQLEAVHHGVPLLTMPFAGDQETNAALAKARGFGLILQRLTLTEEDVFSSITEIITNPVYAQNVKKCSAIQKSLPSSQESFLFWVNHVLEFGGDHLRSPALDMPMYQVLMLDVLLFYAVIIIVLTAISVFTCRRCLRKCCSSTKQKRE